MRDAAVESGPFEQDIWKVRKSGGIAGLKDQSFVDKAERLKRSRQIKHDMEI